MIFSLNPVYNVPAFEVEPISTASKKLPVEISLTSPVYLLISLADITKISPLLGFIITKYILLK